MSKDLTFQRLSLIKFVKGILLISLNYAEQVRFSNRNPPSHPAQMYVTTTLGFVMGFLEIVFVIMILFKKREWVASLSLVTLIPSVLFGYLLTQLIDPGVLNELILALFLQSVMGLILGLAALDLLLIVSLHLQKE